MADPGAKQGRDARRIRATLITIVVVAGGLAAVEGWLAGRSGSVGLWVLCAATAVFSATLLIGLGINAHGRTDLAVFVSCIAILGIQTAYVVVFPRAYPALAIASMVTVALALSFVRGRQLFGIVLATWAVAVVAILLGVLGHTPFEIPAAADAPILLGSGLAAVTVGMVLLWQFARDMTEALRESQDANEQLSQAHVLLHEQERAKSRFINAAAHELNTPMTPILLQLHLLRKGPHPVQDPQQTRMLEVLDRNLGRMNSLVHEMLDVARLQAGRIGLKPVEMDLAATLNAAVEDFVLVGEAKGVTLTKGAPTHVVVRADPRRVQQVLSNLVSNAVRLTPPGGTVTLSLRSEPQGAVVRVRDTGVGLAADQLAALFQPFSRLHDEAISGAGSGLGLFICQGLAQEMGGRLWAESDGPGKGATFCFQLPLPAGSSPPGP